MNIRRLIAVAAFSVFPLANLSGCATATAPAAPAAPAAPVAAVPAPAQQPKDQEASRNEQDWNLFPDPTTGRVDVYYKGKYMGAVTGNEPPNQDPPRPHQVPNPSPAIIP